MKKLLSILLSLTVFVGATTPNACFAAGDNKPQTTVQKKVANNKGKIAVAVSAAAAAAYLTVNTILTRVAIKNVYSSAQLTKMEKALAIAKNVLLGKFYNKDAVKVLEDVFAEIQSRKTAAETVQKNNAEQLNNVEKDLKDRHEAELKNFNANKASVTEADTKAVTDAAKKVEAQQARIDAQKKADEAAAKKAAEEAAAKKAAEEAAAKKAAEAAAKKVAEEAAAKKAAEEAAAKKDTQEAANNESK